MTQEQDFKLISSIPAGPQPEGEIEESTENTSFTSVPEYCPHGEGVEGSEGMAANVSRSVEEVSEYTETFSNLINPDDLPPLVRDASDTQEDLEDKDCMILGVLCMGSGASPNVFGVYDKRRVYPPFYVIPYGPPSSDKGMLIACRWLVEPIEQEFEKMNLQLQEEYKAKQVEYLAMDKTTRQTTPTSPEPALRSLWIPANSSASACYQALGDNDGWGITFETEADTLSTTLSQDYGDYSSGLRAAFHHEPITLRRRKEKEFIKIDEPRWAVMLTCTPGQLPLLFKSFENGLGSRFVFYGKSRRLRWHNVFADNERTIDEQFQEFGQRFKGIYDELVMRKDSPIQVVFSKTQQAQFNQFFSELQTEQFGLYGDDLIASVRRLGLVCFRIAMVLTILRYEGSMPIIELLSQAIVVDDRDFKTAITISNCLINHTAHVYADIFNCGKDDKSKNETADMLNQEKSLYESLDTEYTTDDARRAAEKLGIKWKSAERYLGKYVGKYRIAVRITNGHYKKIKK